MSKIITVQYLAKNVVQMHGASTRLLRFDMFYYPRSGARKR
ncbi:hypothetical protein SAMN06295998_12019 [Primorskyibacter flagellatus]|uniref:Uncharacterized protein n=1 Tax=Primorskyibacter flagellatus TaxID=1387277 RepID=A0A1W2E034_9RHOB|nr:hypothetical protein SAMN06295998_12019 [Primorskyibacter flagellatus]